MILNNETVNMLSRLDKAVQVLFSPNYRIVLCSESIYLLYENTRVYQASLGEGYTGEYSTYLGNGKYSDFIEVVFNSYENFNENISQFCTLLKTEAQNLWHNKYNKNPPEHGIIILDEYII